MCHENRPVRMRDEDKSVESVVIKDLLDLSTHLFLFEYRACDPETYRHDLDGDNADLIVGMTEIRVRCGI